MSTHTPGPWKVLNGRRFNPNYPYQIIAESGEIITTWGSICRRGKAEGQANARLIAAAPKLLEAAKYALQFIEEYDPDLMLHPSLRGALKQAIAKAEGGE